jgi:hypothetical protein
MKDPVLKIYHAIEHYKNIGKSDEWIQSRIIGCLAHYNLFATIQKHTGDCADMSVLQIVKETGDY